MKKPPPAGGGFRASESASGLLADLAVHEVVELLLLDPEPFVLDGEERRPRIEYLLELRVARRFLGVEFPRGLEAGLHDRPREIAELRAAGDETLQRGRSWRPASRPRGN